MKKILSKKSLLCLAACFSSGALALSFLSIFQKYILGADPFDPIGFIIPVLFGGISGATIGKYFITSKELNLKLQQRVTTLEDFLPICSYCKSIKKEDSDPKKIDSWVRMESYISERTSSTFSHGICPECEIKEREKLKLLKKKRENG